MQTLDPQVAAQLQAFRDEINQTVARHPFTGFGTGYSPEPSYREEMQTVDPRILASGVADTINDIYSLFDRLEKTNHRVEQLETIALRLFVCLAEALECGKPNTPGNPARRMTQQDWQNWTNAIAQYQEFIRQIDR